MCICCSNVRAGELTEKQVEVLSACREDCERLDKLMRDLLDVSRIEAGESKPSFEASQNERSAQRGHKGIATASRSERTRFQS